MMNETDMRKMWEMWKGEEGRKEDLPKVILNDKGEEVEDEEGRTEEWARSYEKLGTPWWEERFDEEWRKKVQAEVEEWGKERNVQEELDGPVRKEEVEWGIKQLKKGKAGGLEEIVPEMLMEGKETMVIAVLELFRVVHEKEKFPRDWKRGGVVPLFKKGDRRDLGNY